MKLKVVNFVLLIILINSPLRKCNSAFENVRDKRTVGVFFRSFVDAFQTQRQPAPKVVSFKAPRQSSLPQSLQSDIFSSSKSFFQQKQNLLKPASTQAPVTETITTKPAPATSLPSVFAKPISQAPVNQTGNFPLNLPQTAPIDPLGNLILPHGPHPMAPLKAQILILPFQGHQGPVTPFSGFGSQLGGIPPFNYQAEIYLHPPSSGVFTSGHYPGRYSHDNGWHDVDEMFSKPIQASNKKAVKDRIGVENLTKLKNVDLNKYEYEANVESQTTESKLIENSDSSGFLNYHSDGYSENGVEGHRKDIHIQPHQNGYSNYLPSVPLFFPQLSSHSDFSVPTFGNMYGDVQSGFHFDDQNRGFHQLVDEECKKLPAEELNNVPVEPQTAAPQNTQDRARVNDAGVLQIRGDTANFVHDYTPQREVKSKTKENPHQETNEHLPDYGLFHLPEYNNAHHPVQDYIHSSERDNNYNYYDKNYLQNDQYHTKFGELPNIYQESQKRYEHPLPTLKNPHSGETEITDSHPNGYYHLKRSYIAKRHD